VAQEDDVSPSGAGATCTAVLFRFNRVGSSKGQAIEQVRALNGRSADIPEKEFASGQIVGPWPNETME